MMMDTRDRLGEVRQSHQDLEDFYHELFDPVLERDGWELEADYDRAIEALVEATEFELSRNQDELSDDEFREWVKDYLETYGGSLGKYMIFDTDTFQLQLTVNKYGRNLLTGDLTYYPTRLHFEAQAGPDTLTYELRDAYERIARQHQTEYLEPMELNERKTEEELETIYRIQVPPDYDSQTYQDTVQALTTTVHEIEQFHQGLLEYVSDYTAGDSVRHQ